MSRQSVRPWRSSDEYLDALIRLLERASAAPLCKVSTTGIVVTAPRNKARRLTGFGAWCSASELSFRSFVDIFHPKRLPKVAVDGFRVRRPPAGDAFPGGYQIRSKNRASPAFCIEFSKLRNALHSTSTASVKIPDTPADTDSNGPGKKTLRHTPVEPVYERCGEPGVFRHRLTGAKTVVATPVFFSQSTCGTNSAPAPLESTNAEP